MIDRDLEYFSTLWHCGPVLCWRHFRENKLRKIPWNQFSFILRFFCSSVPPKYGHLLEKLCAEIYPQDAQVCSGFMRHKTCLVGPQVLEKHGVPYQKVVQEEREIIIGKYHTKFWNWIFRCTMLQKLSKCEVKAWLCWNLIILPQIWFYVKSNYGGFNRSKSVIFANFKDSELWIFGKFRTWKLLKL